MEFVVLNFKKFLKANKVNSVDVSYNLEINHAISSKHVGVYIYAFNFSFNGFTVIVIVKTTLINALVKNETEKLRVEYKDIIDAVLRRKGFEVLSLTIENPSLKIAVLPLDEDSHNTEPIVSHVFKHIP